MKPTPSQTRAVKTDARYVCVDAGAGSGKTRVLIERIVDRLARRECGLEQMVAITFTEKAALEMKERLRIACRMRAKAAEQNPNEQSYWRTLERGADTARITTIHSFCMAIVKEHALRLGMDPDFAILEETDAYLLLRDTVESSLRELYDKGFEPALRLAVEFGGAALAAIAMDLMGRHGLAARLWAEEHGDTTPEALAEVWKARIEKQNQDQADALRECPELARLYSEVMELKAECHNTKDKREVSRALLEWAIREIQSGSPNRVTASLGRLREVDGRTGSKSNWSSMEAFKRPIEIRDRVKEIGDEYTIIEFLPERELTAAQATLDLAAVLTAIDNDFVKAKQRMNVADFDDLLSEAHRILSAHEAIRADVAEGIRHLFVDEFQDTDSLQYSIVSLLASGSQGVSRFIVGDAKQSIYLFRGAEVDVFQRARLEADERIRLGVNFRSLPNVFAFIDDFYRHTNLLASVEPEYSETETSRSPVGDARIEFLIPDPIPDDEHEEANAEAYRRLDAAMIASRIKSLCAPSTGIDIADPATGSIRKAAYGDIALLFRSFSNVPLYERTLREAGIPFTVVAGTGYYERQEVLDLRNLLSVVADPWNEMALLAVLRGPFVGISDETLLRLRLTPSGNIARAFYGEIVTGVDTEDDLLAAGRLLLADLRARAEWPPTALLRYILERTQFEAMQLGQFLGVQKASNVRKVLDLAEGYVRSHSPSLPAFLRFLAEAAAEEIREGEVSLQVEDNQSVIVMTVHKSKGLEFPIVFIPDMSRKSEPAATAHALSERSLGLAVRVPDTRGKTDSSAMFTLINQKRKQAERQESARVLYVAMTRARDYLVLSGSPKPTANSWFEPMKARWDLANVQDGTVIEGMGWKGRVVRRVNPTTAEFEPQETSTPVDQASASRVAPIAAPRANDAVWRATAIAAILAETSEIDEPCSVSGSKDYSLDSTVRGDLVHRFFDRLHHGNTPESASASIAREAGLHGPARQAFEEDLLSMNCRFSRYIADQGWLGRAMQGVEVPFTLQVNGHIIRGAVDLVLPDGSILDYKTGAHRKATHAKYEWQLRIYAIAMKTIRGVAPPRAFVFYVDEREKGELVSVDVSPACLTGGFDQVAAVLNSSHPGPNG
ncbi:MAG: hypothetical protein AMXMBFR84_34000 [Candidatus Hydrogenedentota bacterium]